MNIEIHIRPIKIWTEYSDILECQVPRRFQYEIMGTDGKFKTYEYGDYVIPADQEVLPAEGCPNEYYNALVETMYDFHVPDSPRYQQLVGGLQYDLQRQRDEEQLTVFWDAANSSAPIEAVNYIEV